MDLGPYNNGANGINGLLCKNGGQRDRLLNLSMKIMKHSLLLRFNGSAFFFLRET